MRNLQNVRVKVSSSYEKICPFPVGYIYLSTNSTSPASTYGGSWSPLTDSKFLRPAGSWNATGGESTHTLTANEMPAHSHSFTWSWAAGVKCNGGDVWSIALQNPWQNGKILDINNGIQDQGGNAAHNNIPPYRTCYAWYRTA